MFKRFRSKRQEVGQVFLRAELETGKVYKGFRSPVEACKWLRTAAAIDVVGSFEIRDNQGSVIESLTF